MRIITALLLVSSSLTAAEAPATAIVGPMVDMAVVRSSVTTSWKLLDAANATVKDVGSALAFIDAPLDMLGSAAAGKLYQYGFTGYPEGDLSRIPLHFAVANCHQSSVPIAEYVLANVLEWVVGVRAMDASLRECTWRAEAPGNTCGGARKVHGQVSSRTLGILGYGHIGEAVAVRAAAFGMRVIATTLNPPAVPPQPLAWIGDDAKNGELFSQSDFLVVCLPLLNSTRGIVGAQLLKQMGSAAVLINIARGPVVDEGALYEALRSGAIGGAVLDVWWKDIFRLQPGGVGPKSWPSQFRFDQLPNVIMTPHESGDTNEAFVTAAKTIASNLDSLALGKPLDNVVRKAQSQGGAPR